MNKTLLSNILKYTIGLPILVVFTIVIPFAILFLFVLSGETENGFEWIKETWRPNK